MLLSNLVFQNSFLAWVLRVSTAKTIVDGNKFQDKYRLGFPCCKLAQPSNPEAKLLQHRKLLWKNGHGNVLVNLRSRGNPLATPRGTLIYI
ncbi:hypothetical protein CPB84DRAFT_1781142 [Gymnopilus junonius]|uniref:Uncharacterized protein n=1 Tax=Gymnopilus junonius TaxID=109634 RepID=A0A9P5NMV6_GYMJU|nr:hypothetical protein CPB84DRAFT_1781142 [Gymnopilus junonius]